MHRGSISTFKDEAYWGSGEQWEKGGLYRREIQIVTEHRGGARKKEKEMFQNYTSPVSSSLNSHESINGTRSALRIVHDEAKGGREFGKKRKCETGAPNTQKCVDVITIDETKKKRGKKISAVIEEATGPSQNNTKKRTPEKKRNKKKKEKNTTTPKEEKKLANLSTWVSSKGKGRETLKERVRMRGGDK